MNASTPKCLLVRQLKRAFQPMSIRDGTDLMSMARFLSREMKTGRHNIRSTQSSWLGTPGTTKLEPGSILDRDDLIPDHPSLLTQKSLGYSFSAGTESSQNNLNGVDVPQ